MGQHNANILFIMGIYKHQIEERKKISLFYGNLSYSYLIQIYHKASKGHLSRDILIFLENRLDVALYRLSFAPTLYAARQLIHHKKVTVNGQKISFASYQLQPGDIISLDNEWKPNKWASHHSLRELGRNPLESEIQKKDLGKNRFHSSPKNVKSGIQNKGLPVQPKPIHFEVSYKLKKAIYLYSPQKIGVYNSHSELNKKKSALSSAQKTSNSFRGSAQNRQHQRIPPFDLDSIWRSLTR